MSETRELFGRMWQTLQDRQDWEARQRLSYVARNKGVARKNKPFPTAADLRLMLIDQRVNQKKAFTLAQLNGAPRLGTFVSYRQQLAETTQSASDFLDFELKHRSNLLDIMDAVADTMWLRGRGIIKAYVDPYDDYKIVHENVDPLFILMPDSAIDFSDADEWVHVRQISVNKFKNDRRYFNRTLTPMDENDLNRKVQLIRGGKDAFDRLKTQRGRDFDEIQLDKELVEGITHSNSSDTIIVWEHYVRTMGGITTFSYCPVAMDIEIRKPFGLPYKVGGRVSENFFSFPAEKKDEGWYASRGLGEILLPKQIYGSKAWSAKADAMTFFNTPMLTSEVPLQNPANYRMVPGEYMPGNVRPIQFGQPAISFDQEIAFARGEAELDSQSVDIGIEKPNNRSGDKRTAKEVGVASSLAQVGQNYAGGLFMKCMAKLLAFDWNLCLQYKRKSLTYFISDDLQTLPEQALHDEYLITPGGSPEDWDKTQKIQRAMSRLETLKGAPNVNQDELVRDLLTADDARLVKRLLVPQAQKAASEAEDEAMEIVIMTDGFPAQVKPGEDHLTRIKVLLGWLQKQGMQGAPLDKVAQQRIHEHLATHMKFLQQLQPQAYKQLVQQIQQAERQPMRPQVQAPQGMPPQRQLQAPQPQSEMAMV